MTNVQTRKNVLFGSNMQVIYNLCCLRATNWCWSGTVKCKTFTSSTSTCCVVHSVLLNKLSCIWKYNARMYVGFFCQETPKESWPVRRFVVLISKVLVFLWAKTQSRKCFVVVITSLMQFEQLWQCPPAVPWRPSGDEIAVIGMIKKTTEQFCVPTCSWQVQCNTPIIKDYVHARCVYNIITCIHVMCDRLLSLYTRLWLPDFVTLEYDWVWHLKIHGNRFALKYRTF